MEKLPNEILNHIIFDLMYVSDIRSCLLTSKLFHVLSDNQLMIYKNSLKGMDYLLKNNLLDSLGIINPTRSPESIIRPQESFIYCCKHGYLECIKWIYSKYGTKLNDKEAFNACCLFGQLDSAIWIKKSHCTGHYDLSILTLKIILNNSEKGNLEFLKWFHSEYRSKVDYYFENGFQNSCLYNQFETAKWFYEKYPSVYYCNSFGLIFKHCCYRGYLDIVKWFHSLDRGNSLEWCLNINEIFKQTCNSMINGCINSKQVDIIKWLYETYPQYISKEDFDKFVQ